MAFVENYSSIVNYAELPNSWIDEFGVKYSCDQKRLLKAPESLEEYVIKNTTVVICDNAFYGCQNLKFISIPDGVVKLGAASFAECYGHEYISFPNTLEIIGREAFVRCRNLKQITLPTRLRIIGDNAFTYCCSLGSIYIPSGVEAIGNAAFSGARGLRSIVVDKNNIHYDSRNECNAIIVSKNDTIIAGCANSTIPSNIAHICKECFSMDELKEYNIPQRLIDDLCENADNNTLVCSLDWSLGITDNFNGTYSKDGKRFLGLDNIGIVEYRISSDVQYICNGAFAQCLSLKKVTMPQSVVEVGELAFAFCESLEEIELSTKITKIEKGTFCHCKSLRSICVPEGVAVIGKDAFYGCKKLKTVSLPTTIGIIGKDAFDGCHCLEQILVPHRYKELYDCLLPQLKSIIKERLDSNNSNLTTNVKLTTIVDGKLLSKDIISTNLDGKFGIFDVIRSGGYRVKEEYLNIFAEEEYNIGEIKEIRFNKDEELLILKFDTVIQEEFNTLVFSINYEKIHIDFLLNNSYQYCFDSTYDRTTSLRDLYDAFCILPITSERNVIITLRGKVYGSRYIGNYFSERMIENLEPLEPA